MRVVFLSMDNNFPKKIELVGVLKHPEDEWWDPEDYPVSGAMGCFSESSTSDLHKKHKVEGVPYGPKKKDWESTKEIIMRETSGRGHGAVLDQSAFVYSIDNLTRASTLFLCGPEYGAHVQQSLRRANAERGFFDLSGEEEFDGSRGFIEVSKRGDDLMERQFDLYERMIAKDSAGDPKVPIEDARIILPLNTKTAIQTGWNARELMHLKSMAERMDVGYDVFDTVEEMYSEAEKVAPRLMKNRGSNFEILSWFPSPQLFAKSNPSLERIANQGNGFQFRGFSKGLELSEEEVRQAVEDRDEALLSDLKHYHFSFVAPMSLMSFHQATRQRTWNQAVEPLRNAVGRGEYIVPNNISGTEFEEEFSSLAEESINYVRKNGDNVNSYGVVPHALKVYDAIHINGWNALHSVGKRTCKTAQWEIRGIARGIADKIREVAPELGKYSLPQGMLYGTCPERENCGACKPGERG